MKPYTLIFLWGLLLLAPGVSYGQGADVDQRVSSALVLAKKNDLSAVYSLCDSYGESILPRFRRHISDTDPDVRLAVETAAAHFNSPRAKEILLPLVRDQERNVAEFALRDFVRLFPPATLSKTDGRGFNDGLLTRTKRGDASGQSILLLAYFPQTPKTIALLNSLHTPGSDTIGLEGSLPVQKNTVLDVTLAQLGDKAAGERIAALIHGGPVASVTEVAATIPFLADPGLLLQATALLQDTRLSTRTRGGQGYGGPGTVFPPMTRQRVCDLALTEFADRKPSAVRLDVSVGSRRPFTQDELNKSYDELRAFYKSRSEAR